MLNVINIENRVILVRDADLVVLQIFSIDMHCYYMFNVVTIIMYIILILKENMMKSNRLLSTFGFLFWNMHIQKHYNLVNLIMLLQLQCNIMHYIPNANKIVFWLRAS